MRSFITTFLACLTVCITGCKSLPPELAKGLHSVKWPRGSVIQYASVPAGTTLLAHKHNNMPAYHITNACYAVLIDEQPDYDYAHGEHLFLVAADGTVTTLFHSNGMPDFAFQQKDGSALRLNRTRY